MPELWDQLAQQAVAEPPSLWPNGDRAPLRITVGGPTMRDGGQAPGYSLDPFNPPPVEYVGKPLAKALAYTLEHINNLGRGFVGASQQYSGEQFPEQAMARTGEYPMLSTDFEPVQQAVNMMDPLIANLWGVGAASIPRGAIGAAGSKMVQPEVGGLAFPAAEAADRLRLKLAREAKTAQTGAPLPGEPSNPRIVIRAPEGPQLDLGGAPLPDFVAGDVTFQDWIARHSNLLKPDEINSAAKWYQEIYGNFLQQTKGDEALAKQYMRSWLVAQQNVDVTGAMGNALLQREQVLRGVPEDKMIGGGMPNPTIAARRVMQDRPIEGGVGQKISDFVDSAEGKNVRSWMGNDPAGGSPFVVDVHTARDTGMVDQELINHLRRRGYDEKGLKDLITDLGTSPSQTQYENRGNFGRDLTQHLNNIGFQGRKDWTPEQVQAVGWMGMTRLTANKADDVATGLQGQRRHLAMELSPGAGSPWAEKYGARFSALPAEHQYDLTHRMTQSAIDRASKISGVDVSNIVHATGGWQNVQNPSTVAQTFSSKQGAEIAANVLGHLLQQTEVWSNKIKPRTAAPKGFAVDFIADGKHTFDTDAGLRDFWAKITAADPTGHFQGYQPIRTQDGRIGIRALVDRGGAKTAKDLENAVSTDIKKVLEDIPGGIEAKFHEAEITKARNDWTKDKDGAAYRKRLVDLLGRDPTADLRRHGSELEKELGKALDDFERKGRAGKAKAVEPGGRLAPALFDQEPVKPGGGLAEGLFGSETGMGKTTRVPISQIEHGESAMPGGSLTVPGSQKLIAEYAAQKTPFPPIDAIPPDVAGGKWMIEDGSRRFEAAKLRGDTHIDVNEFIPFMAGKK